MYNKSTLMIKHIRYKTLKVNNGKRRGFSRPLNTLYCLLTKNSSHAPSWPRNEDTSSISE
jgi:hypothetical protein